MSNIFSPSEVIQLGIQIEKNGRDFYLGVAKLAKSEKIRKVLNYLAEEEEKHIKVFNDILSGIEKYEPQEAYPDEYFAYLRALSDGYVFTKKKKGEEIAAKVKDEKEAVDVGINAEKDSILFYEEMKKFILKDTYGTIDKLIEEEKKHLSKLYELKKSF